MTTDANLDLLRRRLGDIAREVEFAGRSSWYRTPGTALDAYRRFLQESLDAGAPWVRILGEPPWEPGSKSHLRSWTRYEAILNLAFAAEPVSVMCPYDARKVGEEVVRLARSTHPQTAEPAGLASSPDYEDPLDLVLEL